ncbi:hypothetical protein N9E12_03820, partial [Candidatus Marinimicrobia bacterium]|nr:hypothetical protein [Candidatus Neomarinimicrobiota bacterium]
MRKLVAHIVIVIKLINFLKLIIFIAGISFRLDANIIEITTQEGADVELGEVLEITWKSDLPSDATVNLSYSYSGSAWYDIEKVRAEEESYFWIIPEHIHVNDGMISIRIMSGYSIDYTKLKVKGFAKKVAKSNSYQRTAPKK